MKVVSQARQVPSAVLQDWANAIIDNLSAAGFQEDRLVVL